MQSICNSLYAVNVRVRKFLNQIVKNNTTTTTTDSFKRIVLRDRRPYGIFTVSSSEKQTYALPLDKPINFDLSIVKGLT